MLHGPSGTGKTLLAKAIATESEANFISVKGPELISKWIGESNAALERYSEGQDSFLLALYSLIVDSIAPIRGGGMEVYGGHGNTERVVSQLLTEMDGIQEMHGVVVLPTNRVDIIDMALLRPGRFDKVIYTKS